MSLQNILSKKEIIHFDSKPRLNENEKDILFAVPKSVLQPIEDSMKIYFILLYGYFKVTNKFLCSLEKDENIEYLMNKFNIVKTEKKFNDSACYRYRKIIKNYLGIIDYDDKVKNTLQKEADKLANNFINRKAIFYSLVQLSKKLNIEIPSYTELSKIITIALNSQKKDILNKLSPYLEDKRLKVLDEFLKKESDNKRRWNLSYYKKMEHSTNKGQIALSIDKFQVIKSKFEILKEIIDAIGLTSKTAEYYAKWIEKSQIFQVKRKKSIESNFLLLSFVYHQYFIRNDNLIDRFISTVQSAKTSSYRAQKEFAFENEPQKNRVINLLEENSFSSLNEIRTILQDSKLSALKKVSALDALVDDKLKIIADISKERRTLQSSAKNKYAFIEQKSISLQGKLSGILKSIEFDEKSSDKNIIEAIQYFKADNTFTNKAPSDFLSDEEKAIIFDGDKFKVSLYKALLFFYVSDSIKNGTLNLKYSIRYKEFDAYMIDKDYWTKNRDELLKTYDLKHLKDFNKFIEQIKIKLETSFKNTNENIKNKKNIHFTSTENSYILKTPKVEKNENQDSISKYFPQSEYLSIIDILNVINEETDFLSSFQHYSHTKVKTNHNLLLAGILGYGCNLTLSKIGKISKGINGNQLENTKIWYFSEDNTIDANDKIIKYMDGLEIVKMMRASKNINHTSSDGQKYNIAQSIESTNAGYSFKYFATSKGVVSYTFVDESHKLFHAVVINVSARESGYVIDGLLNNNVVKSDIHSTDTHGFTEVIFGLTNMLGFSFAPRIKNFKDQQLYGFNSPKYYKELDYKLTPKRKINLKIIEDNWDDILRFIITIKEKKSTATQLLKRLTSYSKQHKLYRAIKELGKIIKTDFLLNYIDDVQLRQKIEKQLNKVEASNKFSKAVFFGNNNEFTVSTAEEQNIANNSKRLIQNAIILWNYMYITKKIEQSKHKKRKMKLEKH